MSKNFYKKINSFHVKVVLSLLVLGCFLLAILFILIVPKMQKEQIKYATNQIENVITLTKLQLKLAVKFLINHGKTKKEENKAQILYQVSKIENQLLQNKNNHSIEDILNLGSQKIQCETYFWNENQTLLYSTQKQNHFEDILNHPSKNIWIPIAKKESYNVCPTSPQHILYSTQVGQNNLSILCSPKRFTNAEQSFESRIKKDIQKSFHLAHDTHKGKVYLMWVDVKYANSTNKPMYNSKDDYFNPKYCISKISDLTKPPTGLLSAKNLLDAADKKPIRHLLNTKERPNIYDTPALTWVRSINTDAKRRLLFITTVYESDFDNKIDSSFWKIFPASILALLFAFAAGFFLFKRLFKSITILSNTAREVNKGNIAIRSHVKGKDDIGVLGNAFDNMLDSIEDNIQALDEQVENKTQELRHSLREKETLLQEVHHRVKNNLAMTINLIKLQKVKIEDENTQEVLEDIQKRIFTMELLHRKLYESKDLNSIPLKKYIEELIEDIQESYTASQNICIHLDIDRITMNIEYAMPCGLIINEAMTNAFKYAFTQKQGNIYLHLKKNQNNYTLCIKDDGVGLPKEIDIFKSKSLGLRLITSITKNQLLGEIKIIPAKGFGFEINFQIS